MRVVLDPNILISSLLSSTGAPGQVLRSWLNGEFELVASRGLLTELGRALAYPKLRSRMSADDAKGVVDLLERTATMVDDPSPGPRRSRDPGDDYLLVLAESSSALLVTGDEDLLSLRQLPIESAGAFLLKLRSGRWNARDRD